MRFAARNAKDGPVVAAPPDRQAPASGRGAQLRVCPAPPPAHIGRMPCRPIRVALALAALALTSHAAEAPLALYDHVVIASAKSSIYVGTLTLSLSPAHRENAAYECTYTAKVFPYFFMSESGRLHLDAPDESLRRLARGETVEFRGTGASDSGEKRRFEGQAFPASATAGRLKVRVFVSKRISFAFDTTYQLGPAGK